MLNLMNISHEHVKGLVKYIRHGDVPKEQQYMISFADAIAYGETIEEALSNFEAVVKTTY